MRPLPNVWLGVSVEDQATADERILQLLGTPAALRFVSYEPALGPVDLDCYLSRTNMPEFRGKPGFRDPLPGLGWVIAGGESGPHARPAHIDWFRAARNQCAAAGVPFFLKQLGRCPISTRDEGEPWLELIDGDGKPTGEWGFDGADRAGGDPSEWPDDLRVREYPA